MRRENNIKKIFTRVQIPNLAQLLEPNLKDPRLSRQQRLLNLVLAGLAIPGSLFGLVMLVFWALGKTPITGAIAGLGIQPFYLLSYWLGRRGKVTLAAYIPVGAVFLVMLGATFQLGIGHVTYIGFAMATLTAGILIGNSAGLVVAVLSTLANMMIGSLQVNGGIPSALAPITTVVADSVGMGLGLVVLIAFTGIYGNELKKALFIQQALSAELQVNQANLESLVRHRTRALERRVNQIRTAAEISRSISAVLEPKKLLQQVVDLLKERFDLYYAGVFLIEEDGVSPPGIAVLQAGTGEAGQKMLAEGHKLAVGGPSMVGWATFHRQPRIALDVELSDSEIARFHNPHLPLTRSELALPILLGDRCLGAITIQSTQENAFDEDDITILQAIADSLAIALENARLYQQSQASLEEIRTLHRQYLSRMWAEVKRPPEEISYTFETERPLDAELQGKPAVIEVPLILREQSIGKLTIESGAHDFSAEERALIEAIATETAIALENARLLDETQLRAQRERLLSEFSTKIRASSDIDVILRTAILELGRALRASEGLIQLDVKSTLNSQMTQGELKNRI